MKRKTVFFKTWPALVSALVIVGVIAAFASAQRPRQTGHYPVTVFISVDVETPLNANTPDAFKSGVMIDGSTVSEPTGVPAMVALLEKYHMKGNFFFNVYEWSQHTPTTRLPLLAKSLTQQGHAVELHTHPSSKLPFYTQLITTYPLAQQKTILHYGQQLITDWTGQQPRIHRGGAYTVNNDTLLALQQLGITMDSSVFAGSKNNQFSKVFTLNQTKLVDGIIEFPVTVAYNAHCGNHGPITKLDIDWLSASKIEDALIQAKTHHLRYVGLMLHSFSFLNFRRGHYTVANATVNHHKKQRFEQVLKFLSQDHDYNVMLWRDWHPEQTPFTPEGNEYVPVL